jgi:ankyrin repeat protein
MFWRPWRWQNGLDVGSLSLTGFVLTLSRSFIIDHLLDTLKGQLMGVAWCYCDYRERLSLTPVTFAASLLRQLSVQMKPFPQPVFDFYELFKTESPQKQSKYLIKTLISVCSTFSECFVVVDALDEIDPKHRKDFLKILKELQSASVKIFVTTRPHLHDISETFSSDIRQPVEAHENDIKTFLTSSLANSENMEELLDDRMTEEVINTLSQNANGMFLLPALQIQAILDQVSKSGIRSILRSLSSDLHEVFGSFIERIKSQPGSRQQVASAALTWLAYAKRNLSIDELRHALATRLGDTKLDQDNMISPRIIVESCLGLLVIEQENSAIRLVHFSLQEYLQTHRQDLFPNGDLTLAATCLTYSTFSSVLHRFQDNQADLASLVQDYPLLAYSCNHWGHHAGLSMTPTIRKLAMKYLSEKARVVGASKIMDWGSERIAPSHESQHLFATGNSLHCVSMFGLAELIPDLVRKGASIRELDHRGNSPLHEATYFTQFETASALLKEGATVDEVNYEWNTALFLASASGHVELLELLLKCEANPNAICKHNWTPLHKAADCGHLKAVELLLDHGASLTKASSRGLTALHRASGRGHLEMVQLLLSRCSEVNAQTFDGWTPLHGAASSGRNDVVQLLLRKKAEVDHVARDGCTPLHRACLGGHLDTVRTLLQFGAEHIVADESGEIPLHKAAKGGHVSVVHLLLGDELEMGAAQLEFSNILSQVPRDIALNAAYYDLAKLLTVDYDNFNDQNEVELMIKSGNLSKIERLLAEGIVPDKPDNNGLTPLHQAVSDEKYEIASMLVDHGANIEHAALNGWTPLHTASKRGNMDCVNLCLQHKAQVTSQDRFKRTPLHKACQGGNVDIVRLLIENNADPEAGDWVGYKAIHACAEAGHEDIARFLVFEQHVSVESRAVVGLTPQAVAAGAGHHDLAEFLRAQR